MLRHHLHLLWRLIASLGLVAALTLAPSSTYADEIDGDPPSADGADGADSIGSGGDGGDGGVVAGDDDAVSGDGDDDDDDDDDSDDDDGTYARAKLPDTGAPAGLRQIGATGYLLVIGGLSLLGASRRKNTVGS